MSASEIRLALSYSIQKEAYIVTNTYQDIGTQPHTPYCTWWIFSQPHHAWPFLPPCRSPIPFSLKPIMILYCHRVIIVFHFQVPGPLSIWNMMEGWQVTDHPLFFFSVLLVTQVLYESSWRGYRRIIPRLCVHLPYCGGYGECCAQLTDSVHGGGMGLDYVHDWIWIDSKRLMKDWPPHPRSFAVKMSHQ